MPREIPAITIAGRRIAADVPPFVIAEIGLNHHGSTGRALALVDAAADAGAHAIKLQTFEARDLVAPGCPAPAHVPAGSMIDFFQTFELDEAAHARSSIARAASDCAYSRRRSPSAPSICSIASASTRTRSRAAT
jgi:sialic acid synthase SpsE